MGGIRRPPPAHLALCLLYPSLFTVCLSSLQACERDAQCGFGLCCAVSLWLRGLRMCVPRGVEGDECHPFSHKVCVCVGRRGTRGHQSSRITTSATRATHSVSRPHLFSELLEVGEVMIWPDIKALAVWLSFRKAADNCSSY